MSISASCFSDSLNDWFKLVCIVSTVFCSTFWPAMSSVSCSVLMQICRSGFGVVGMFDQSFFLFLDFLGGVSGV